jgi:ATP-dependent RNA helicase RhlE
MNIATGASPVEFSDLGLCAPLLKAIADSGYRHPTPIQKLAIPAVLSGQDILAAAQTGTGKTAGFALPMLHMMVAAPSRHRAIRALVLTPTRELAAQVEESVRHYGVHLPLRSAVIFGGVGQANQVQQLRLGVDILVATPGRLLDLHQQGLVDLSHVEFFVLDEADRMLDMGFIHDIRKVLAMLPKDKQSLLFSATFSDDIKALAQKLLREPRVIEAARPNTAARTIEQRIYPVDRERKKELLLHLLQKNGWQQVLVFTRMKHGANRLAEYLNDHGVSAMAIHGNKSQSARTKALQEFKSANLRVLVATDIASRGIDIDALPLVINYELPNVAEDYVHRIGRTGRAGVSGLALSLVCVDEHEFLSDIEKLLKTPLERVVEPGFEPDPRARPEPIRMGRHNPLPKGGPRPGGPRRAGTGRAPAHPGQGRRSPR